MSTRFTIDGSDSLERTLAALCDKARAGILEIIPKGNLHALVLGGGYGRGEGGVLRVGEIECPYNDLEYFVLLHGGDLLAARRYKSKVHDLGETLTALAGIEVEFKLLSFRKFQGSPVSMFYYDLLNGHRLLQGSDEWFAGCDHHRAAHRIPLHEATRLLMNRCSGLLYAQERLMRPEWSRADADFTGRNLAKAKLAFGDVVLTMHGQYHWSCRERQRRLKKLAGENPSGTFPSLLALHEQGVEFKLHPSRSERPQDSLRAELDFLKVIGRDLWLQLESRRLGRTFPTVDAYATEVTAKCPETRPIKNRLINARTFGTRSILDTRYPRERLLRTLPLLLWADWPRFLSILQNELRTNASDFSDLVKAYEVLWKLYN